MRWANEDPNPRAKAEKAQDLANQVYNAVMATQGPASYPDMSALTTGDAYPTTDGQYYTEAIPADYQQALQYASTYSSSSSTGTGAELEQSYPAHVGPSEESALALLSSYDAESYAERYASTDPQTSTTTTQQTESQQSTGVQAPDAAQHQSYTADQWRQWYMVCVLSLRPREPSSVYCALTG